MRKCVTPSRKLEKEPDLVQQTCIEQQENNPVTISRHVESINDGGSSPHEPTLRDPPHGEDLNVEPVLQSAGVKDGETSAIKKRRPVRRRNLSRDRVIHPRGQL